MSGPPTHQHVIEFDGEQLPVVSPTSMLDCDRPACRARADVAQRATWWSMEHINQRIADAEQGVKSAMDLLDLWLLVKEAKERSDVS